MIINNNMSALRALGFLKKTDNKLNNTIKKLSAGLRINQAADDAAGLSISEVMRSRIKGMEKASQNTQDGISMLQTAEGALGETQNILQRMRELAVQAANDTLTSDDRHFIQLEISGLKEEINHIARATNFNNKKLLDGTAGAIWSSNDLSLRANMKGGITSLDQFGQKINSEGNYNIEIKADPGQAQVLKSNVVTVIVPEEIDYEIFLNTELDTLNASSGDGWEFQDGVLTISGDGKYNIIGDPDNVNNVNRIVVKSGAEATIFLNDVNIDLSAETDTSKACAFYIESGSTANVYLNGDNTLISGAGRAGLEVPDGATLTISSKNGNGSLNGTLIAKGGGSSGNAGGAGIGGSGMSGIASQGGTMIFRGGTIEATGANYGAGIGGGHTGSGGGGGYIEIHGGYIIAKGGGVDNPSGGGAGIGNGTHGGTASDITDITITGGKVEAYGGPNVTGNAGIGSACHSAGILNITIKGGLISSGAVTAVAGGTDADDIGNGFDSIATLTMDLNADIKTPSARSTPSLPKTEIASDCTLDQISQFYDDNGAFSVEDPQKLTITQGNGKSAQVTLYKYDTMYDVAEKINNAIANDLGQAAYVDDATQFCTISDGTANTSESIKTVDGLTTYATMLVRSAVAGKNGELSFTGSEQVLKALGLNTIQEAVDTQYNVSIKDAHTGKSIADNIVITKNKISGVIHENLEIEFDDMAGTSASWDNEKKLYNLSSSSYTGTLHLANRGITFQTGADHGDEVIVNIGDMSTKSLGIDGVNVSTRELASQAISLIDRAADTVITQRAKLGAYIGTLGHTIENLANEVANLSEAESRIRDADMAKETMDLVELQILVESGTSMLAQANQTSQAVLSLVNGR